MNCTAAANYSPAWSRGASSHLGCLVSRVGGSVDGLTVSTTGDLVVDARLAKSCPGILRQQMTLSLCGDLTLIVPRLDVIGGLKVASADGLQHALLIEVEVRTSVLNDVVLSPGTTADPFVIVKPRAPGKVFVLGTSSSNAKVSTGGFATAEAASLANMKSTERSARFTIDALHLLWTLPLAILVGVPLWFAAWLNWCGYGRCFGSHK